MQGLLLQAETATGARPAMGRRQIETDRVLAAGPGLGNIGPGRGYTGSQETEESEEESMNKVRVRASSLAEFFDCPARWSAKHLDGKRMPSSVPAAVGTAVHKSTAVYDDARMSGDPCTPDDAAELALKYLAEPDEEIDWRGTSMNKAVTVALGVHTRYCVDIAPTRTYYAVETPLPDLPVVFEELGVEILLTGTLDRLICTDKPKVFGVADIKTGARALSQSTGKHRAQLGVYEILASVMLDEMDAGTIDGPGELIQLQTSSQYEVGVSPVVDARSLLLGTDENTGLLTHMARSLASGDFWGNPSSWLCNEKYCPNWATCFYR